MRTAPRERLVERVERKETTELAVPSRLMVWRWKLKKRRETRKETSTREMR